MRTFEYCITASTEAQYHIQYMKLTFCIIILIIPCLIRWNALKTGQIVPDFAKDTMRLSSLWVIFVLMSEITYYIGYSVLQFVHFLLGFFA